MRNKKVFNRSLSLLLSLVMILSMLPMTVFGVSMSNMTTGTKGIPGVGPGDDKWMGYGDIHGYKISVWYAPQIDVDANLNPIYGWNNPKDDYWGPRQIGKTLYWRKSEIQYRGGNMPSFWTEDSIYDQVTNGYGYRRIYYHPATENNFEYYITQPLSNYGMSQTDIDKMVMGYYNTFYQRLVEMKSSGLQETFGYKELYDYLSRMYDSTQKHRESTNYSYEPDKLLTVNTLKDSNARMTSNNYVLPFSYAQTESYSNSKSAEEIRSYFLNPVVLNEIAYLAVSGTDSPAFRVEDFLLGTYDVYDKGQYKIYIEPVYYRYFYGEAGVMSWRDMMYQYRDAVASGKNSKLYESPIYQAIATYQVSDAMALQNPEPTLKEKTTGVYLGQYGLSDFSNSNAGAKSRATDLSNSLGVGVLTSPSLTSWDPKIRPDIIKLFVEITDVDENGNITYETVAPTRMGKAAFDVTSTGNITNIASIEPIESDGYNGYGVLNDVFTTDKQLSIDKINNSTVWENTDLPENIGYDLSLTADDISGYCFGILTDSDVFVETFAKTEIQDDTADGQIVDAMIDSYVQGYENATAVNAAAGSESVMVSSYFVYASEEDIEANTPAGEVGETIGVLAVNETGDLGYYQAKRVAQTTTVVDAVEYEYYEDIILGKIDEEDGAVYKITDKDKEEMKITTPANTVVLRYIVKPAPKQFNVIEVYDEGSGTSRYLTCLDSLDITDTTVNIKNPNHPDISGLNAPELIDWVTNSERPTKDISNNVLPNKSTDGLEGSGGNRIITDYPVDKPITHNLYVRWKVVIPAIADMYADVPQWRLSKFFEAEKDVPSTYASMTIPINTGCCGDYDLTPTGTWSYKVINPNEHYATSGNNELYTWLHSQTKKIGSTTISKYKTSAMVTISGHMTGIKSTDTTGLKAAKWITDSGTVNGLKNYDIETGLKSTPSNSTSYTAQTLLGSNLSLDFGVYNNHTYYNTYAIGHWSEENGHWHTYSTNTISPSGAIYTDGVISKVRLSFDRYNQSASRPAFTVGSSVINNNGYTAIKYQQDKTLNIYPEYGMLFDNDSNQESIKWMVSDQARLVKPVVYQTLEHKVYVEPSSTGTIATDTRAKQKANAIGESGKPVLYKGAPVNSTFKVYRDNAKDKVGMLTVKTFALDIDTSKVSYNDWGNSGYNGATLNAHKSLVANIDNLGKATVSENLIVSNLPNGATNYIGGTKTSQSNKYEKVKYNNSNTVENKTVSVLTHKLIVRGGQVIGVELQDRNNLSYSKKTIAQLKNSGDPLYEALVNMNLYNESNDKSQTVLSTFEHKAGNTLNEGAYATLLAQTRQSVDGIATPDNAKVTEGSGWYSEDSTVLVVKEYITNYNVPSIAVSDKLSLTINGLNSPANKNDFFSQMGKGHLYLRYDLNISTGAGNANPYFEFTTLKGYKGQNDNTWGKQGCTYLVPNVSVADTTRIN